MISSFYIFLSYILTRPLNNSSFRYINVVLSLNNSRFGDYLHHIYSTELKLTYGKDSQMYSYLDLHIEIDNEGRLKTKLYDMFLAQAL
jgi:hypothetical protein